MTSTATNDATRRQIEAATPDQSTWLSANAGSGKTRVLTDRVARLLLAGTRPENILCLTYTKAAASEMQNRLFQRLGDWAMMPEHQLRPALVKLGDDAFISDAQMRRARTLFAAAIETPGGLKIQTIHSFCAGVLRRFPREAGISPQFRELEDRASELLREEVLEEMAQQTPDVLERFADIHTGGDVADVLAAITARKSAFVEPTKAEDLKRALDLTEGTEPSAALSLAFVGGEQDLVQDLVAFAATTSASYQKFAKALEGLSFTAPTLDDLAQLFDLFLYKDDNSSKSRNWPQSNHTKAVEAFAPITEDVHSWMDRVAAAWDYLCRIRAYEDTVTFLDFAIEFIAGYDAKKAQRAALDFDDLIGKAKALLEDPSVAQWVLFRLDGGVDHVLVDEAQDTSPDQWDIVRLLTQEFSTGEGSHADKKRTVFVVGDKKQSIYSFQGADPEGFNRMSSHFSERLAQVNQRLYNRELRYSFRSSAAVLQLVDQVFIGPMLDGIGDASHHIAFHDALPGRVDLWPVIAKPEKEEPGAWDDPIDKKGQSNHLVVLANQIAAEIKRMTLEETRPVLQDGVWKRQPITAGDFLILVQRRSDLFHEIIRACKSAGLEVAGADRLKLGGELAVKDIASLLRFLALPDDDLSLAEALKSPLFGWTDKDLYGLAQPRLGKQILWEALRKSLTAKTTYDTLKDLRDQADFMRPYDLINRILIRHNGRHTLLARLGQEAEDGIDALLSQALSYEGSNVPSLTGFLSWLETEDVEVKRQIDNAGDRIRVMTVHGAKGLEAPVVILPDTATRQREIRGPFLRSDDQVVWKPNKKTMPKVLKDAAEDMLAAQDRERRRLLYVAMTRAEHWLIIAAAGSAGDDQASWHSTISGALDHLDAVDYIARFGPIKRFSRLEWNGAELAHDRKVTEVDPDPVVFPQILPVVPQQDKPLSPSDLGGMKILPGDVDEEGSDAALAFGRVMHDLLEALPSVLADQRQETAARLIEDHADRVLLADADLAIAETCALIADPDLAWIFSEGLAEVPISASLPSLGHRRIFGIVDRIIARADDIIIVDYKTNRLVPRSADATPDGVMRQMAAYTEAVRQIYPTQTVRAFVLWTQAAKLMELSRKQMSAALARVTTS